MAVFLWQTRPAPISRFVWRPPRQVRFFVLLFSLSSYVSALSVTMVTHHDLLSIFPPIDRSPSADLGLDSIARGCIGVTPAPTRPLDHIGRTYDAPDTSRAHPPAQPHLDERPDGNGATVSA